MKMKTILNRVVASKLLWGLATLMLLYTLGGFLLAPYLLERFLPRYLEQQLEQRVTISDVRINPYLFILEMSGFQLDGTGDRPVLKFNRLYIDFELSSIFARAWTFADIQMDGLDVRLEIDRKGRLNIMDLVKRLQSPEQTDQAPPSLVFEHAIMRDSSISFSDFSGATPASTALAPINLELASFSTIPDREGHYTLAATLPAGGSLTWKGNATLQPLASDGEFSIRGLKLSTAWQFFRDEVQMAEPEGELALGGRYGFYHGQGKTTLGLAGIEAEVSNLLVASLAGGPPLLALRSIRVSDALFTLDDRELAMSKLAFSDGKLTASLDSDGRLNWQSLVPAKGAATSPEDDADGVDAAGEVDAGDGPNTPGDATGRATPPWRVRVENVAIEDIALAYTDHMPSPPLVFHVAALSSNFKLDTAIGSESPQVVAEDMQLTVDKVSVAPAAADAAPLATLDSFGLTGGRLDTLARTASVEKVAMSNGGMAIIRGGSGGPPDLLQLALSPEAKTKEVSRQSDTVPTVSGGVPWKYQVDSVELSQFDVHLADQGFTPPIAYDVNVVSAVIENMDSASEAPITFATELRIGKQGVVNGSGSVGQDFGQGHGKLEATGVALEPLHPLVTRHAALDLKSGHAAVSADLNYRSGGTPLLTAQGSAGVHDFRLNEAGGEERLISWKTLSAEKIALSVAPNRLSIEEVRLLEPGMKLVIDEDKNVNLKQVLKSDPSAAAGEKQGAAAKKPAQNGEDFSAEVTQIRIVDGSLDFADLSLVLPFSTHVHALDGAIAGISSEPGSRAELELAGQVEAYGEASATGVLIPEDPKQYLDIEADFDNIKMAPLSPYSATFAGRKIAAGKLWLNLHYRIVKGNLAGENTVVLTDFKLGERVEAPGALDLPLDLAIGLLKGPDGRIKIAVPVKGDLGNPEFDYGTVIRGALANVIRRVVSAPFRLLAGLLGKDAEELRHVEFDPGSSSIAPAEREKLDSLAGALKQRPQIGLVVRGPYDVQRDGQSLRSERVQRDLAAAMGVKVAAGEDLGLIAYGDADTQKALEKLLTKRAGANAVEKFADEYAKRTGQEPDRVNPLLGLFGRGSEDRAFYTALFEHLVELQPPLEGALRSLAADRAQAIMDVLLEAGIDSKHLISGGIEPVTAEPGTPIAAELSIDATPDGPDQQQ